MFNYRMSRLFFTLLLIFFTMGVFAQYVHYSDKRKLDNNTQPGQTTPAPLQKAPTPVIKRDTLTDTLRTVVHDTLKVVVRDTVHVVVRDTVRITDTIRVTIHDTVRSAPVYHKWPDRCPGLSGAVPVLTNYVPRELVPKLTEMFKGHLYSITSVKVPGNKFNYKMRVCENGEIKFEYANENGDLIPGR